MAEIKAVGAYRWEEDEKWENEFQERGAEKEDKTREPGGFKDGIGKENKEREEKKVEEQERRGTIWDEGEAETTKANEKG